MLPSSKATRDVVGHHGREACKSGGSCSNSLGQTPFRIAIVVLPKHDVQPIQPPMQMQGRISLR